MQVERGIHRDAVIPDLDGKVGAMRMAGADDAADALSARDELAFLDVDLGKMRVDGGEAVGVAHDDHIAVPADAVSRVDHVAGAGRSDRRSGARGNIDALVLAAVTPSE